MRLINRLAEPERDELRTLLRDVIANGARTGDEVIVHALDLMRVRAAFARRWGDVDKRARLNRLAALLGEHEVEAVDLARWVLETIAGRAAAA